MKKTMSEKSLISVFALLNILPVVIPTLRKFCNLDCLPVYPYAFDKFTSGRFVNLCASTSHYNAVSVGQLKTA